MDPKQETGLHCVQFSAWLVVLDASEIRIVDVKTERATKSCTGRKGVNFPDRSQLVDRAGVIRWVLYRIEYVQSEQMQIRIYEIRREHT